MHIVIIGSCTKKKRYTLKEMASCADLDDVMAGRKKTSHLQAYSLPAIEMYTGKQHLYTKEAFHNLENVIGKAQTKFYILSSGYGLIPHDMEITPYECSLTDLSVDQIKSRASFLKTSGVFKKVTANADLVFILLGVRYLYLLGLPFHLPQKPTYLFLCSDKGTKLLPHQPNIFYIKLGLGEARKFRVPLISLKGLLLRKFSRRVVQIPSTLEKLHANPEGFLTMLS